MAVTLKTMTLSHGLIPMDQHFFPVNPSPPKKSDSSPCAISLRHHANSSHLIHQLDADTCKENGVLMPRCSKCGPQPLTQPILPSHFLELEWSRSPCLVNSITWPPQSHQNSAHISSKFSFVLSIRSSSPNAQLTHQRRPRQPPTKWSKSAPVSFSLRTSRISCYSDLN